MPVQNDVTKHFCVQTDKIDIEPFWCKSEDLYLHSFKSADLKNSFINKISPVGRLVASLAQVFRLAPVSSRKISGWSTHVTGYR